MKIRNEFLIPIIKDTYILDFDRKRANRDIELMISVLEKYFFVDSYAAHELRNYNLDYLEYFTGGKNNAR